ncbi:MAG: hypothetical protein FJ096_04215 [Deltaproteobacteria bacterium]|nr:hypothetical protein [Deltaproteobacteria bacterium]
MQEPRPPFRVANYEVTERIAASRGRAGAGGVFHARCFGASFVLHLVESPRGTSLATLLRHEQLTQRLPGLPRLVDVLEENGRLAVVFERPTGLTLAALLDRLRATGGRLTDETTGYLCHAVATTLAACHAGDDAEGRPIVSIHGGISEENVFLTGDGAVLVQGSCPFLGGAELGSGEVVGPASSDWKAPEVRRGEAPTPAADAYGVSWLVRVLLSGFLGPDPALVTASMAMLRPDLPPTLAMTLDRAVLPSAAERATCAELARALVALDRREVGRQGLRDWLSRLGVTTTPRRDEDFGSPPSTDLERTALFVRGFEHSEAPLPTPPQELISTPFVLPSSSPVPGTTRPVAASSSAPPSDDRLTDRAVDDRITNRAGVESLMGLDEHALDGTLILDPSDLIETTLPERPVTPAVPEPMRARAPSLAPRPAVGFMTVIDDGEPDPQPRGKRPSLADLLEATPSARPSVPPLPPPPAPRERSSLESSHPPSSSAEGEPSLEPPPSVPRLVARDDEAAIRSAIQPDLASELPARAHARAPAVAVLDAGQPQPSRQGRSRSTVALLSVVLVVVWVIAGALYLRDRGRSSRRARANVGLHSVATVARAESPHPSAASASVAPTTIASAPTPSVDERERAEPAATASADTLIEPTPPASSADPAASGSAAPAASAAPPAPSVTGTRDANSFVVVVEMPEASAPVTGAESLLTVRSSLDANVFVNGQLVGRTHRKAKAPCGWRNVRLGVASGPFWLSKPLVLDLPCTGSIQVDIEPDGRLMMLEKARTSTVR